MAACLLVVESWPWDSQITDTKSLRQWFFLKPGVVLSKLNCIFMCENLLQLSNYISAPIKKIFKKLTTTCHTKSWIYHSHSSLTKTRILFFIIIIILHQVFRRTGGLTKMLNIRGSPTWRLVFLRSIFQSVFKELNETLRLWIGLLRELENMLSFNLTFFIRSLK